MLDLVWLIPALPLVGFLLLIVFGRRLGEPMAGYVATACVAGSFVIACLVFAGLVDRPGEERFFIQTLFEWVPLGNFSVDVGFLVDPLSMTMVLFVTGIAALIHLYAVGYMAGDPDFSKFFIYLNLFVFSMLLLVLGDSLLLTFVGWEGVGACSYLLVSFWFTDEANASAGKKAFVTNRIGDFGFMLAMFLAVFTVGSLNYAELLTRAPEIAGVTATGLALLLFLGAVGKSAQLPLYVWLPDAMAGPTPVSALIHAATMVTAGVYLLVRVSPVLVAAYDWAPDLIAWVGAITALFAASIAIAQNDIKKVLAYSTISQLGYLFLAVGVGGYSAAIFHMVTHAFFKALLFLGAGSVIHGMHHEQDMRRYGGLFKLLPVTAATFIVGWLAIAGVPPFSGFWSKDEILAHAYEHNLALWLVGLVAAVATAFYMAREVFMTFFGRYRYADPTPAEMDEAWEARAAGAEASARDAQGVVATASEAVASARQQLEAAEVALAKATGDAHSAEGAAAAVPAADLEAARTAVAEAADKDAKKAADRALKDLEKPAKDLEKSRTALGKAEAALATARTAVTEAEGGVGEAETNAASAGTVVAAARADASRHVPTPTMVDLLEAPVVDPAIDEYLAPEVAHRREFHPHESPWQMLLPLVVLAGGALVAGMLNLPFSNGVHFLANWLEPSMLGNEVHLGLSGVTQVLLAAVAVAGGLLGIAVAVQVYLRGQGNRGAIEQPAFARAWFVDETFARVAAGPGRRFFDACAWFDRNVIDGAVNGLARVVRSTAAGLRTFQTGYVRTYALGVAVGAVALLGLLLSKASF
ncbi:MAG: NADH-quinone oxidoreductase subunit L [Acidimicrobiia bacterium]|nr:NADH-quinone oxidoreductase subunit L [Acidimicrobiia bacterium]